MKRRRRTSNARRPFCERDDRPAGPRQRTQGVRGGTVQYEASRDDVRVKKDYSVIRTPYGGVVSKKYTEVGELLLPGKQIVTVVDPTGSTCWRPSMRWMWGGFVRGSRLPSPLTRSRAKSSAAPSGGYRHRERRKAGDPDRDVWIYFTAKDARIKPGCPPTSNPHYDAHGGPVRAPPRPSSSGRQEAGLYR